ncbi:MULTISPECIES: hypothetical protein [unclassified Serratia (in: enterobacteria)]|uniref:hypothetical protein n=1 Tax=unclassified Serratia (in: enterobacteria) TaxID=2647522 RepID=UPI00068E7AE0|nr:MULTISPECIES: hypothetical protein [unclassified Serratia (in: enterobacteria)]
MKEKGFTAQECFYVKDELFFFTNSIDIDVKHPKSIDNVNGFLECIEGEQLTQDVSFVSVKSTIPREIAFKGERKDIEYLFLECFDSELKQWIEFLNTFYNDNEVGGVEGYIRYVMNVVSRDEKYSYDAVLSKILDSYLSYERECVKAERSYVEASVQSLLQIFRYIPFIYDKNNLDFYIDGETGFFGILRQLKHKNKGTLNILVKDNSELIYSYVKRKNGIMKYSGRGYTGKDLRNSDGILAILNIMDW